MIPLVLTCRKYLGTRVRWIRDTWGQEANAFYLVGDPSIRKSKKGSNSLIRVPVDESDPRYSDSYLGASWKIYAGIQAIYDRYCPDRLFICDDDTFCIWRRVESLRDAHWIGRRNGYFHWDTVFGGSGFVLSKEAIEAILATPFESTEEWGDVWISKILYQSGLRLNNNDGFLPYESYFDGDFGKVITCHPVTTQPAFNRLWSDTKTLK